MRKGKTRRHLPEKGVETEKLLQVVAENGHASKKHYTNGGSTSGTVYTADEDHWEFISKVMGHTIVSNPLHYDEFQFVTTCEAEIIRWTLDLYKGDENTCGIVTSGGTESILLSMLAYREMYKDLKGITRPNIVCSETAHCAFNKAAFYFGIDIIKIPVTKDFEVDLKGMEQAIDGNTICIVSSCPEYAFGTFDPTEKIAALAQKYNIGCHADCCLGSYVNPFAEELGYKTQYGYDFSVPGVTSISCDPHKYAYGPKGCSLALFRDKKLRQYQIFVNATWQGGIYSTTCMAGSRPGCVIVGTWASFLKHGTNGLKEKAKKILYAQQQVKLAFDGDKDIQIISKTPSPIISFTSSSVNCIAMSELLIKNHHWGVAKLQRPHGAHFAFTDASSEHWKGLVSAIKQSTELMKKDESLNTNQDTAVYGMTSAIPDRSTLRQFITLHQDAMLDTLDDPKE